LHLLVYRGVSVAELAEGLEQRSGLLGVSGVSGDLRAVLAAADAGNARARLAYGRFVLSLRRAVGAMAGVLGGVDAVVFSGGIGEHSARARRDGAAALAFAGLVLDPERNRDDRVDAEISVAGAAVRAFVVHAREDLVILRACARLLGWASGDR
jgi:acetate kinase